MSKENALAVFENFKIRRVLRREVGDLVFFGGGHHRGADPAAGLPDGTEVLESLKKRLDKGGQSVGDKL